MELGVRCGLGRNLLKLGVVKQAMQGWSEQGHKSILTAHISRPGKTRILILALQDVVHFQTN
jgi:hypothetical protein